MKATLTKAYAVADAYPELAGLCARLAEWREPPTAWIGGRCAWHVLEPGIAEQTGLHALKLKGLGSPPRDGAPAAPPTAELHDRWPGEEPDKHFGIGPDLEFWLADGDPAPSGGLGLRSAARELDCAVSLQRHGVPTIVPIAQFRYDELAFTSANGSEPMGVAISGSSTAQRERCALLVPGWHAPSEQQRAGLASLAKVLQPGQVDLSSPDVTLAMLAEAYRSFGASLRGFTDSGWYRYSGHADNFSIDGTGAAVLVDLDSCRPVGPAGWARAALEGVRDGMSGLYNLACAFFLPGVVRAVTDEVLVRAEPFSAFLDGWDPASAGTNAATGQAIARYVIEAREVLRRFSVFMDAEDPAAELLYRYVRHDRDLTFSWFYRMLFRRRLAGRSTKLPFGLDALDARLLRFAGRPRFERMMALENGLHP